MCYSVLGSEINRDWEILITSYLISTHNNMEMPGLSKMVQNRKPTHQTETHDFSKQNSTHTHACTSKYAHMHTSTQALERLLEVTWLFGKLQNNEANIILTFWWWSRSSLRNCVNSWGINAWSVQEQKEPNFCNPVSVLILLGVLASVFAFYIHPLRHRSSSSAPAFW